MKKIPLLILISILICFLVGCNKNRENEFGDILENEELVQQGNEEISNSSGEANSVDKEIIIDTEANGKYENIFKDYVFEDSDKKIIRYDNELYKYSKDELEIGKNEIFARYGYDFDSESLEKYFKAKSWYEKIDGKKITFNELNTYEQENVKDIDEYIKLLKEVENCKDINTVEVPDLVLDKTLINAEILIDTDKTEDVDVWSDESNKYVKISDDYVLDEKWDENLHHEYFENHKEILPKKIFLMKDNINCYYEYNGEIYYIPVEKCDTPEEERIEYREHGLVVYRMNDIAKVWDLEIQMYDENGDDEYFVGMDLLYISNLKYKSEHKVYEIDLDGDINTVELSVPCYYLDPGDGIEQTSVVASKNSDKTSITSGVDYFLCGNIGNYRNVFYSKGFSRGLPLNMFIEECYLVRYYIYDKEDGFITVNRFANGDKWNENLEKMNSYELTLNYDITFYKEKNESEDERYDYTTWGYYLDDESLESVILPKGTKVRLVNILDWATNSIIETEDGTRYKIASYAGMT